MRSLVTLRAATMALALVTSPAYGGQRHAGGQGSQGGSVISSVTVTVIINNAAPNVDPHWIWCYGKGGASPTHEYTERCP